MTDVRSLHEPAPDRLLAPTVTSLARALGARLPAGALSVAGMVTAAGALWALLAGANVAAGLLVLAAALLDVVGAAGGRRSAARSHAGFGAVLDGVADRYADTFILAGMAAWSRAHEHRPAPLAVGFAALIGALALSYTVARVQASAGAGAAARLFGWTGRDVRALVAAGGALTGQVYIALVIIALLTHLPVMWALVRLRRPRSAG